MNHREEVQSLPNNWMTLVEAAGALVVRGLQNVHVASVGGVPRWLECEVRVEGEDQPLSLPVVRMSRDADGLVVDVVNRERLDAWMATLGKPMTL